MYIKKQIYIYIYSRVASELLATQALYIYTYIYIYVYTLAATSLGRWSTEIS